MSHTSFAVLDLLTDCIMCALLWFNVTRNEEYLSPGKAKAMQRLQEELCSELRGVAVQLVDAFAIPDIILRAPIGLSVDGSNNIYRDYLSAAGFVTS